MVIMVIASVNPFQLLAWERQEMYARRFEVDRTVNATKERKRTNGKTVRPGGLRNRAEVGGKADS